MTRSLRPLILPALLIALSCDAVGAEVKGDCFSYEREVVQLTGRIVIKTVPGPPNYQSIAKGDKPERPWFLRLAKPICTKADPEDVAEAGVLDIHLVLQSDQYRRLRQIMRKGPVTLTGTLFHSFNAHHHAKVLMSVTRVNPR